MSHIILENVSVNFPIRETKSRASRVEKVHKLIGGRLSNSQRSININALDNVSLHFKSGDRVGLIGHNGAGKTTLLRALAGVYPPSSGKVIHSGKIVPLFDISLGFDMETTGHENILLRGLFLGLSKSKIQSSMDKIAEFTGLGTYLDMPLRTYSSGMLMRLAFAIATEVEPDIILMDEWIAVGDSSFMEQAKQRLTGFIDKSSILVLATHSEDLIRSTCNKALLIGQGQILAEGTVDDVYSHYRFFGSSNIFDMDEYVNQYPDLKEAKEGHGLAPWMHFLQHGIAEGRSPGYGINLRAFSADKVYNRAVDIGDGLAAAQRIEQIVPFLRGFKLPKTWRKNSIYSYPMDFIATDEFPLIMPEEAEHLYSDG
ncbi:ABC transporter ATP-binding protein [Rhodospirillaceae bacterium]|nr:ABC transporter ATP-binding protein [Rhodospirillaceae bacterium]